MLNSEISSLNNRSAQGRLSSTETVSLSYPVNIDGLEVSSLMMRRPLVRDRLIAEKASGSETEKEIRLIANLCDMAPQHIELLDLADYNKLQECLAGFLS